MLLSLLCPSVAITGSPFPVTIEIDSIDSIGAYHIEVPLPPRVHVIEVIGLQPFQTFWNVSNNTLYISGFQNQSLLEPTGDFPVSQVAFETELTKGLTLTPSEGELYNTNLEQLPITLESCKIQLHATRLRR